MSRKPRYEHVQREERGLPDKNTCVSRGEEEYWLRPMRPWEDIPSYLGLKEDTQCSEPQISCSWTLSVYDLVLCLPTNQALLHPALKTPGEFLTFDIFLSKQEKRSRDTTSARGSFSLLKKKNGAPLRQH